MKNQSGSNLATPHPYPLRWSRIGRKQIHTAYAADTVYLIERRGGDWIMQSRSEGDFAERKGETLGELQEHAGRSAAQDLRHRALHAIADYAAESDPSALYLAELAEAAEQALEAAGGDGLDSPADVALAAAWERIVQVAHDELIEVCAIHAPSAT